MSSYSVLFRIILIISHCLHHFHFKDDIFIFSIFNTIESKWIIVWLVLLSIPLRWITLISCSHCGHCLSMSSHSTLLWFIIIVASLLCCTAWKGLEMLVSLSLSGHRVQGWGCLLVSAHRCNIAIFPHDIVLQSVSTCYNPIIQLHYCRKDLLWYFPNEWNFVSGGQQLTRLIHSLRYM